MKRGFNNIYGCSNCNICTECSTCTNELFKNTRYNTPENNMIHNILKCLRVLKNGKKEHESALDGLSEIYWKYIKNGFSYESTEVMTYKRAYDIVLSNINDFDIKITKMRESLNKEIEIQSYENKRRRYN
jgi:hypothetical protein